MKKMREECESMEGTHDYTAIKDTANNGGSCTGGFGKRHSTSMQCRIAVVVGEVETRHCRYFLGRYVKC